MRLLKHMKLNVMYIYLCLSTITDDTVLDDFVFGEHISDSKLRERFKNKNWLVFV